MMVAAPLTSPDEAALRRDLAAGRFLMGVATNRWRLVSLNWPYVVVAVAAADRTEYGLRFECMNYPQTAVTAAMWDFENDIPLATGKWPTGKSRIPLAFNPDWKDGSCLYLPCDRQSIEGHECWINQHPALLWEPSKGICKYLNIVHQMLNASDYGGRRVAA